MKPLLSQKVQRGEIMNEWKPAEHHLTHAGQVEFMARMQARIAAAQERAQTARMLAISEARKA